MKIRITLQKISGAAASMELAFDNFGSGASKEILHRHFKLIKLMQDKTFNNTFCIIFT